MPDMLVRLYDLPDAAAERARLGAVGINIRAAMPYEKHQVLAWVEEHFSAAWASECAAAFAQAPVACHIATQAGRILGFACHDCTCPDYFGPTGVDEASRGQGVGRALLLANLHAMRARGYAYAIIGGVGPADFYARTVGAVLIEGSTPGIYRDRLSASASGHKLGK